MFDTALSARPATERAAPTPAPRPVVLLTRQPVLAAPARGITAATVNLMAREGRGLICHAMTAAQMLDLGLHLIPQNDPRPDRWRYAVSYEARRGCSTGISAADRALTLNAGAAGSGDGPGIAVPGHVIPVLGDPTAPDPEGHPPSAVLALLAAAGIAGGAAICTILDADGQVASRAEALALARRLSLAALDPATGTANGGLAWPT